MLGSNSYKCTEQKSLQDAKLVDRRGSNSYKCTEQKINCVHCLHI